MCFRGKAFQLVSSAGNDRSVTVAMHIGLERNLPMLDNLVGSFEACVEHDAPLELVLVDSSGSDSIYNWIDCYSCKRRDVSVKKLRPKFPDGTHMSTAYMQSLMLAIAEASGRYFALLAEDNQFVVRGKLLSSYIDAIEAVPDSKAIVHLMGQQQYKYSKANNSFMPPKIVGSSSMFELETTKWCPFALCRRDAYIQFGEVPISDAASPHATIEHLSSCARELGYTRFYPQVPHGAWLPNEFGRMASQKIDTLAAGELLIKSIGLDEAEWSASTCYMHDDLLRPMSAEDFMKMGGLL